MTWGYIPVIDGSYKDYILFFGSYAGLYKDHMGYRTKGAEGARKVMDGPNQNTTTVTSLNLPFPTSKD